MGGKPEPYMSMRKSYYGFDIRALLVMVVIIMVVGLYKLSQGKLSTDTSTVGTKIETNGSNAGVVKTETSGITIVRDRGARLNFVPAKAGTNVGK